MLPKRMLFDEFLREEVKGMSSDVYVKDNCYHIEMDIPGYEKEDINIELDQGLIKIKVSNESKSEVEEKNYIRQERKYNKLERTFYFSDIDEDKIHADYKNGTLHLTLPKKVEETKRQIKID